MQKLLFSVFDNKSNIFSNPFTSVNLLTALRDFCSASRDPNSDLYKYPEDFSLYELGSFDDSLGIITLHPQPITHGNALQFKEN